MSSPSRIDIPAYSEFLPEPLLARLSAEAEPIAGVPGLRVARGLTEQFPAIETAEALALVCEVYRATREQLAAVLHQRVIDRAFCDAQTRALV
ncbi:MAG TPA: hypothetical protein PLW65_08110, partial [Pseudomonadota bacterium]|nr:hypothetical protein [Pseudomonadota bacterium]